MVKHFIARIGALIPALLLAASLAPANTALAAEPARASSLLGPATPAVAATPVLTDRFPERRVTFPDGVTALADVIYHTPAGSQPLKLDLYLPRSASQPGSALPLVLYIHGGGWSAGHSRHSGAFENWPQVLASLAARGYAVASLNYRLMGEARYPAALLDVKAAIRYLRAAAAQYGIDRSRALTWGGSAGGHLASAAGTSCGVRELEPQMSGPAAAESDCVQAVLTWYGVLDFSAMAATPAWRSSNIGRYFGCTAEGCGEAALQLASPIRQVGAQTPPHFLIHGERDAVVPIAQSQNFHAAMQSSGRSSDLLSIPEVDHSFIGGTHETTRAASLRALEASFAFIDRALKAKP